MGSFFKNKDLSLNNINIKFRTFNALENYNRKFKYMDGMGPNKPAAVYIDNIIEDIKDHINIIRESEEKIELKYLSTYNIYINLNDKDNITEAFGEVSEEILEFIENIEKNFDLNSENEINNEIENSKMNGGFSGQNINNKHNKKEKEILSINWFQNQDNSCAYDSIYNSFYNIFKKLY